MNETLVPSGSALTHIHKPIAVSITLSRFIHLSHKCPVGLFHHIFQLLPSFRSRKGLRVLESQQWHRPPAREQCPNISEHSSPLCLWIPTWAAAVQQPTPSFSFSLPLHSALGLFHASERATARSFETLCYFESYILFKYISRDSCCLNVWINVEQLPLKQP